jgi:hypothetical protein
MPIQVSGRHTRHRDVPHDARKDHLLSTASSKPVAAQIFKADDFKWHELSHRGATSFCRFGATVGPMMIRIHAFAAVLALGLFSTSANSLDVTIRSSIE